MPSADGWATYYRDTGCEVSKLCQLCPLPRCRYETPSNERRTAANAPRDRQIIAARSLGTAVDEIAAHFGVSRRQVHRITSGGRMNAASTPASASRSYLPGRSAGGIVHVPPPEGHFPVTFRAAAAVETREPSPAVRSVLGRSAAYGLSERSGVLSGAASFSCFFRFQRQIRLPR